MNVSYYINELILILLLIHLIICFIRKKPTLLKHVADQDIVYISAGALHNAIINKDGAVLTWGCNDDFALGRGK
jgi:hypothetical protein